MREAVHRSHGEIAVPATSLDVYREERVALVSGNRREARTLAMLAAGLVRPSAGSVLIGEFDPRVQPVHCKRIAGFVPHEPLSVAPAAFLRYVKYRAALWEIEPERARAHAALLLERLSGLHEAFAYPIVAALIASPKLLVLDRPQLAHARQIVAASGRIAIFSTHLDAESAQTFGPLLEESRP